MSSKTTNGKRLKIEYIDPKKLKPCSFSSRLYGDVPDDGFVERIKKNGVREPIQVLPGYAVLGGHMRRQGAILAGLREVPIIIRWDIDPGDELAVQEHVILLNDYRKKTGDIIAREATELLRIESARAELRKQATQRNGNFPVVPISARPGKQGEYQHSALPKGRAVEVVAKSLGIGKGKVQEAVAVQAEIDRLKSLGHSDEAFELQDKLENESVHVAYKSLKAEAQPVATPPSPFDEALAQHDWVFKHGIPRFVELALDLQRLLGYDAGQFSADRIKGLMTAVGKEFNLVKGTLANAQAKSRKAAG